MNESIDTNVVEIIADAVAFLRQSNPSRDEVWRLIAWLHGDAERATVTFRRHGWQIALLWLASFATHEGTISGAALVPLTVTNLNVVVLVAPLALSLLYHRMVSLAKMYTIQNRIIYECYRVLFPAASREQLQGILLTARGLLLEELVARGTIWREHRKLRLTSALVVLCVLLAPVALVLHAAWLSAASDYSAGGRVSIISVSVALLFRSLYLVSLRVGSTADAA